MTDIKPLTKQLCSRLEQAITTAQGPLVLANSLGFEDMLLTDVMSRHFPMIDVFVLETGRLMESSLELLAQAQARYSNLNFNIYTPNTSQLENYVNAYGINAFYQSTDLRKACCHIRKVEPLARALEGKSGWITGQRRVHSQGRAEVALEEHDDKHAMPKYNPLADWGTAAVWAYIKAHDVPYNPLHDSHYPSIGCAPCTRAISTGEDMRAGRWWWENDDAQECGLHVSSDLR